MRHFYKSIPTSDTSRLKRVLSRMQYRYAKPFATCPKEFEFERSDENCVNVGILPTLNKSYYKKLLKVDDARV